MSRSTLIRSRSEAVLSLVGNTPLVTLLCDRAERYFSTPLFDAPENQTALQ